MVGSIGRNGVAALLALFTSLLGEASGSTAMGASADAKPSLNRIVPDRGPAGAAYPFEVTLHGAGFATSDNEIQFGPVRLSGISSPDGKTIAFNAPKETMARNEVPPIVLPAGEYEVLVTTAAGTSNVLSFKLLPSP